MPNWPPTITLTAPALGCSLKQTDSVSIQFSLRDPDNNASFVEIYVDNKYYTTVPAGTKTLKLYPLPVGEHIISIYAFDSEGKGHEKSTRFKVVSAVNVKIEKNTPLMSLFPNPAENRITISINPPADGNLRIEITSTAGKSVVRLDKEAITTTAIEIPVDLTYFGRGTYVVTAYLSNKRLAQAKMIVN